MGRVHFAASVALFLEHRAEGLPSLKHSAAPMMFYRWHGHVWIRYPLPGKDVPAGAVLHQKNAYAAIPHSAKEGPKLLEDLRHRLVNPYSASAGELNRAVAANDQPGQLARPGEAGIVRFRRSCCGTRC